MASYLKTIKNLIKFNTYEKISIESKDDNIQDYDNSKIDNYEIIKEYTQKESVNNTEDINNINNDEKITVAIAESVTAGAVANTFCSQKGASEWFRGSVVAYSIQSKKDILGIDINYAEKNNFANPKTTMEMCKSIIKLFNSRIGISTTGYSSPMYRPADDKNNLCELDIKRPYAWIGLYDKLLDKEIVIKVEFDDCEEYLQSNINIYRATVQAKIALRAKKLYDDYLSEITKK